MKFVKKHPYLICTLVIIIASILLKIPFLWVLVILAGFGIICAILNGGTTLGWIGYLMDGTFGWHKLAKKCLKAAYEHHSKCAPGLMDYGLMCMRDGDSVLGQEVLEKTVSMPKINPLFLKHAELDLAIAYWKNGDLNRAISFMEEQLQKYEIFSDSFLATLSYFYIEAGDLDKALDCSDRALKVNESCAGAYDNLGEIAFQKGDIAEAKRNYLRAIECKRNLADSQYHMGLISEIEGDYEKAAEYFLRAHNCDITGMNTIARETVDAKYNEYFTATGRDESNIAHANPSQESAQKKKETFKKAGSSAAVEDDLDDIEQEFRNEDVPPKNTASQK